MSALELIGAVALVAPGAGVALKVPRSSPRWPLAVSLALAVPGVGPLLALLAMRTRGTNQLERDLEPEPLPVKRIRPEDIRRLGGLPPLLDRLMSVDPADRLCALETIRKRADREAIRLLRWAISHGHADAVLDAALTLEEVELHWRHELEQAEDHLGEEPCYSAAVRFGDLAVDGITNGLVDDAVVDQLAAQARERYDRAAELDPSRHTDVGLRRARLELVAGEPTAAFDMLESLRSSCRNWSAELRALRDRARFKIRRRPSRDISRTIFAAG